MLFYFVSVDCKRFWLRRQCQGQLYFRRRIRTTERIHHKIRHRRDLRRRRVGLRKNQILRVSGDRFRQRWALRILENSLISIYRERGDGDGGGGEMEKEKQIKKTRRWDANRNRFFKQIKRPNVLRNNVIRCRLRTSSSLSFD